MNSRSIGTILMRFSIGALCVILVDRAGGSVLVNQCLRTVIVKYTTSSGGSGTTGPIKMQSEQLISVPAGDSVSWIYCYFDEWSKGICKL